MTGPSPHLAWSELACHDQAHTPYPDEYRGDRAVNLARLFEAIRAQCGHRPIRILSAYRSVAHNRKVGGARHSQHVQGRALDLRPPAGMSLDAFYRICRDCVRRIQGAAGGIGRYQTFVHVDVRPGVRMAAWNGRNAKLRA